MQRPLSEVSSPSPASSALSWKVDLHLHCAEDLRDAVQFTSVELLYRAKELGFSAVAFTLHEYFFVRPELEALACDLGLLLIPGVELRLEGADVVLLNLREDDLPRLKTFADLRALREERGDEIFIFAPHPCYVLGGSMGQERLLQEIDLFDAIEQCHFHTPLLDRNRPALEIAREYGKPVLATSDAHRLSGFGRHYTKVAAPASASPHERPSISALFAALRAGQGVPVSPPMSLGGFASYLFWAFFVHDLRVRLEQA